MLNEIITLDEAINSLRDRPGLVYGPLATTTENSFSLIVEDALKGFSELDIITADNIQTKLEALRIENPEKAKTIEDRIHISLKEMRDVKDITYLVQAGWSMGISLTVDVLFESSLQNYQDSLPTSKTITIVDHQSVKPLTRTIPIYKLLGYLFSNDASGSLALTESELLLKKSSWRHILCTCTDFLQGNPLLFFGTDNVASLTKELLVNLSTLPHPSPSSLIFLKDDPLLKDPTVQQLCNSFSSVKVVDTNIRDFSKAISELNPRKAGLNLTAPSKDIADKYSDSESFVSLVPDKEIGEETFQHHRQALVDSLFRPTSIDWDPYLCSLDIRRDSTDAVIASINEGFNTSSTQKISSVIVRGNAGIGKTTLLKRTAVEMSQQGYVSFWCRRAPIDNWIRAYKKLSEEINQASKTSERPQQYIIFVDDPWYLRLDPAELVACFEKTEVPIVFVFALRNTEYFNQNGSSINFPYISQDEIELPAELTHNETTLLSEMLVRINAVSNKEEADSLVASSLNKNTDDILCSLWYLVPETRNMLAGSLKDEYHRLGSSGNSIEILAQDAQTLGKSVQHAYEYVCVTSNLQVALPMEVLVRALKINYEEFIDISANGKPLWGLIYDEEDKENQTILYRTRNEIVTNVLLDLVNGGGVGHTGEYRILKTLLSSCEIGSHLYREFATEVLVRKRKVLEKKFSYEQGLELYKVAEKALPYEDRLLAHHKGIWMHSVGKEYQSAFNQFDKALELQQYPNERAVHREHIHTSQAASVVALVKEGKQTSSSGLELVQELLQKASNPKIFNAHAGHVHASLLFELAQQANKDVSIKSYSGALQEIEKTLQSIGPNWKKSTRADESIEMLRGLQGRIITSIPNDTDLDKYAYESFDKDKSQLGFELILRKKFAEAQISDKGSKYNNLKEQIEGILAYIDESHAIPSVEIYAIKVDLMVRWRLQKARGSIDWQELAEDLKRVLESLKYRDNPIKNFYFAVALFHLGEIEQSNAIFSNLRRMRASGLMPKTFRNFFVGPEGHAKRFQCSITRRHGRSYADISELSIEIPVSGSSRETVTHTYIGFSLNGSSAVYDKPDYDRALLA